MTGLEVSGPPVWKTRLRRRGLVEEQGDPAWEALQGIPIVLLPNPAGGITRPVASMYIRLRDWSPGVPIGALAPPPWRRVLISNVNWSASATYNSLRRSTSWSVGRMLSMSWATAPLHEHEHPLLGPRDHDVEQALGYVRIFPPVVVVVNVHKHDRVELEALARLSIDYQDTTLIETDLGTAPSPERGNWRTRVVELTSTDRSACT